MINWTQPLAIIDCPIQSNINHKITIFQQKNRVAKAIEKIKYHDCEAMPEKILITYNKSSCGISWCGKKAETIHLHMHY